MSATTTKPNQRNSITGEPSEEHFWQKYSPRYEFPISNVASVAVHVLALFAIVYLTSRLMKNDDVPPVRIVGHKVPSESLGILPGGAATEGGPKEEAKDREQSTDPKRVVPDPKLKNDAALPKIQIPGLPLEPSPFLFDPPIAKEKPGLKRLADLNEQLKGRIDEINRGTGKNPASKEPGNGKDGPQGGVKPPDSTVERMNRWEILFRTKDGADYLKQLNAFKAKVVIPEPPDWKTNRLFDELTSPNAGRPLKDQELPPMHFVDNKKDSASKVARALGLDFDPPYFIAFFPKEFENDLAAKEQSYRNRKADQIFSTTFRVIERRGEFVITVSDQISAKK